MLESAVVLTFKSISCECPAASVKVKHLDSSPAFVQFTINFSVISDGYIKCVELCSSWSITLIHNNIFPIFKWTGSGHNATQMLDAADLFISSATVTILH